MTKLPYIMLAIALTGAAVGFSDLTHISNGLGKAVFGVFFSLTFITGLVGQAEADHKARTGRQPSPQARLENDRRRAPMGIVGAAAH